MTREEAEDYAKKMSYRDAVCNALQGKCIPYRKATLIKLYELLDMVESPDKTGHWIDDGQYAEGHSQHVYRCSECNKIYIGYIGKYKECPNCRTKMYELTGSEE